MLHLIEPLGFSLEDRYLRRAGLDYHEWVQLQVHRTLRDFCAAVQPSRLFGFSTRGVKQFNEVSYQPGDTLLFGPETRGLPADVAQEVELAQLLRIPMRSEVRSLNLSNAVAVAVYEALRQMHYPSCS